MEGEVFESTLSAQPIAARFTSSLSFIYFFLLVRLHTQSNGLSLCSDSDLQDLCVPSALPCFDPALCQYYFAVNFTLVVSGVDELDLDQVVQVEANVTGEIADKTGGDEIEPNQNQIFCCFTISLSARQVFLSVACRPTFPALH